MKEAKAPIDLRLSWILRARPISAYILDNG